MLKRLLLIAIIFSSCRVSFVPAFDSGVKKQIELGQSMQTELYKVPVYTDSLYNMLAAQIASIKTLEQSRPKSAGLVAIVNLLQLDFNRYRTQHKRIGTFNAAQLSLYDSYMQPHWKDLLLAENSLPKK